nr:hypothetical protein [Candidatus Njordarchaeum guaymaensis]
MRSQAKQSSHNKTKMAIAGTATTFSIMAMMVRSPVLSVVRAA